MAAKPALGNTERGWIEIDPEECKGCGLCIITCPVHCLTLRERLNRQGYVPVQYMGHGCTGCGICFYVCPEPSALTIFQLERPRS